LTTLIKIYIAIEIRNWHRHKCALQWISIC